VPAARAGAADTEAAPTATSSATRNARTPGRMPEGRGTSWAVRVIRRSAPGRGGAGAAVAQAR
jgi:hypothetical protein